MQIVARALDRSGPVVPAESADDTRADAVTVPDLHVVITTRRVRLQTQHHKPEFDGEGPVHFYGPLTPGIVGVALQHQVALSFMNHSSTLHAVSTRPAWTTLSAVFPINKEVVLGAPCPIVATLTVLKNTAPWVYNAGVALIDGVAAAGHCIAHPSPLQGALTADHVIFAAASAHYIPLWTGTVAVQVPVIVGPASP